MSEKNVKTFTVRRLHWWCCAMHDPLVLPPAFDLAYCTISHLNAKNRSPVRDPVGRISEKCAGLRSSLGRFWRAARLRQ